MYSRGQEELLRKLRGRLAFKKQVEPYVIFNDESLDLILKACPKTIEELGTIKGFPLTGKRVAGWGQSIVDIFNKPDNIDDFEIKLDPSGDPISSTVLKKMNVFGK